MKEWIPFLQDLIWPIFIAFMFLLNRSWFKELLDTVNKRIKEGGELNIGPSGISVGKAPVLPEKVDNHDIIDDGYKPEPDEEEPAVEAEPVSMEDTLSLAHRTYFWKMKNGRAYYRILINTHAENDELKSKIEKVVYHLHSTFKNPTRIVTTKDNDFLLKTAAWGEFVARADVYLKDNPNPVKLNRYLDIKA
jgi:prokaryotic YEATS domain